jgi:drug/metabolite transporter (DMT)-like permease
LIGALAPFLIVPIGAWLFREHFTGPAIGFDVLAFGGVALVLRSASPGGDATLAGDVSRWSPWCRSGSLTATSSG